MSERAFRVVLGLWLLAALVWNNRLLHQALVAWLLFEGVTNLRVPKLIGWLRYGRLEASDSACCAEARIGFEAERALRFIVAAFISLPYLVFTEQLWWMPWFVGFALVGAGLSGICPMVLALRKLGFA